MLQALIADSQAETYAAECMILDAARRRDAGEDITMLASCTKLFATEACGRVADRAVQIFGGAGYVSDYGIERFYRDVRIFRLYEGTSQIQQIIIARELAKAAKAGSLSMFEIDLTDPHELGLNADLLAAIPEFFQTHYVDTGKLPCIATPVSLGGQVAQ